MKRQALLPWLQLVDATGIGPILAHKLLKHFLQPSIIFESSNIQLQEVGLSSAQINALRETQQQTEKYNNLWSWLADTNNHVVCYGDALYPPQLSQIHAAPLMLYIQGDVAHLHRHQLAIVGSRNPTAAGRELAQQFAYKLSQRDVVVTSGLALGIDAAAHQGVLNAQGTTIAVLASGLDVIYPKRNQLLAKQIIQNGCLVSEFPLGTQPRPFHFPQRNRIVSGLSAGTLVVEATLKSGSLITAKYALEQNREVFALPGSVLNTQSKGCHQLIKHGASLVESIDDIFMQLPHLSSSHSSIIQQESGTNLTSKESNKSDLTHDENSVIQQLDYHPVSLDWLVQSLNSDAASMAALLMTLELKGKVCCEAGGYSRVTLRK
jgi:DNA processing protein